MSESVSACRKKKLLVILGSGSSLQCGMPGTNDIDAKMKIWSEEWKETPTFPNGIGRGVFNDLWKIAERYYDRNPHPHLGISVNFEKVLGEMTALASWVSPSPFGSILSEVVTNCAASDAFTWPSAPENSPYFFRQLILEQTGYLLGKLADYMRSHARIIRADDDQVICYGNMLQTLSHEFDLGVYNLNYDDMAIRALAGFFTGFENGDFDGGQVSVRQDWNFVYHLHESIHYSLPSVPGGGMIWRDDLSSGFNNSTHAFPYIASGFGPIVPTTLIAGGFKLDQLLADPSQSFYASLVRHSHEADSILIAGYGFGDHHINRALQNRCDVAPRSIGGRPPIAVLTKTSPGMARTAHRHDLWAWELTHAVNARFNTPGTTESFEELVTRNDPEIDTSNRVAIWHGGFLETAARLKAVIQWLQQY